MPNANVLNEKKAIVAELSEKLKSASAGILVNYSGITVAEDTEMRRKLREANVDYSVVKNTLVRFALDGAGLEKLDDLLSGTTALAVSKDDPIAPAKLLSEYASKFVNHFEIKGGFMDGKVISLEDIKSLASIPAIPVLRAQVLGTLLAPITSLAVVLKAIAEKNGAPVNEEPAAEEESAAV